MSEADRRPRLAITLGDPAGIGPEVTVRALLDERVRQCCRAHVVGAPNVFADTVTLLEADEIALNTNVEIESLAEIEPVQFTRGVGDAETGRSAFESLSKAIELALAGDVDGIVTAPLSKHALHLAGHEYPGHTEILAEKCGVHEFAMMLYLPPGEIVRGPHGLAVAHTTLHTSIVSVPGLLTQNRIEQTVRLVDRFLRDVGCDAPRIGVCALNPHAGEEGLFGDEEARIIHPAVAASREADIKAKGPFPADTLMKRAADGEFDGIVAMYHDQGHIALKLLAFGRAVNVTLGLPIIRTSPSHGTAYDVAWQGIADPAGMIAAIQTAAMLAGNRNSPRRHRGTESR